MHHCPLFVRIRHALLNCFVSVALRLALGEVEDAGGQCWWRRVSCMHASTGGPWWSWVVFVGAGHRLGLLCASRSLLLGGRGHLLDGCCCSRTAGIVSVGGLRVTLHGGDMVAKWMWVVIGRFVEVVGGVAGVVVVY